MKILVAGCCGFVGAALCQALRELLADAGLAGFDNLMRPGAELNRRRMRTLGVQFFHADARAASDIAGLPPADWVIDAAAIPDVRAGLAQDSASLMEHNIAGTVHLLEYCRRHGAGLLLLSSSRVYSIPALRSVPLRAENGAFCVDASAALPHGVSAAGIAPEFSTQPPVSLYGASKLAAERLALEYGAAFRFPVWVTRCGILAGAGQFGTPRQGIIAYWIHAHRRRRPLRYTGFGGTGFQTRDIFHPRDLAALLVRQIRSGSPPEPRVWHAGGGAANAISLRRLTDWCDGRFGPHPVASDPAEPPFDVPWVVMDCKAAETELGWRPRIGLDEILEEIARHAESHPEWLEISQA